MAKKRPSATGRAFKKFHSRSKLDAKYWLDRVFRNTFTRDGDRFQVNHWSVKIQRKGIRKTFSLRAAARPEAALESCELYKRIITRGWQSVLTRHNNKSAETDTRAAPVAESLQNGFDTEYWTPRLIQRKYTEPFQVNGGRELSVRIDHAGTSHYFPLGTHNRKLAASRAVQIYRIVAGQGWGSANAAFSRELSVALHWVENPVAWTYTTIHTQPTMPWSPQRSAFVGPGTRPIIAIAESDRGIRQALTWCINQQAGFSCAAIFDSAAAALKEMPTRPSQMLLVSQNLSDMPGSVCLERLKALSPKVPGFVFSVYEDCDQLFKCAPGGASSYLFRRTLPTQILEPIASIVERPFRPRETIADRIRDYFQATVGSLPVGGLAQELITLTHREHEILALLSKGQTDKEIADLLHISTWTVHGHLKRIFEKLGVHNRTEAVLKYLHK